jgi:tRNA (guanine37-N1)-methyltransferase
MRVDIVTIFPEYLAPARLSLIGRASQAGIVQIVVHDLRDWTHDVHRTVDDSPYGGGPGMVMRPEPWGDALDALAGGEPSRARVGPECGARLGPGGPVLVVPTPAGTRFSQSIAAELAGAQHLIFACGRYEGIDQRVLDEAADRMPVRELSIGDYVLFGGEVAVLVMLEAVARLLPGVLGNAESLAQESHVDSLLEAPGYTKPAIWRGRAVPEVLRSGDHGKIARWRRESALARTAQRRPDLLEAALAGLTPTDLRYLTGAGLLEPDAGVAQ